MRRSDREVTEFTDIVSIIEKCDVCRLALNDENYPYILPLNFGMNITEENVLELYFHGATEGTKLDLIAKDNRGLQKITEQVLKWIVSTIWFQILNMGVALWNIKVL